VGLGWDAAQLAGRAARLADDRRATAGLHAAARALHGDSSPARPGADGGAEIAAFEPDEGAGEAPADTGAPALPAPRTDGERAGFTERELEIGRYILAGLTYKQIGGRLYLSAKTVEHHVARMRQRSGAESRDELFGLVRAALESAPAG
jgi:DNA-binding CsgD family transcriptional regulator